ncbi:unnamed protein product (macronuclear) [Paramecium tetraurelia]|uniref:Uncharacterized protein n=1 Tax=Paramecium tetraurelia TaxID=5888 RepID=A0D037_PARTE|nr:uncharacterized protein GSPATT00011956001 [Paramecium tetraurelia]CAK76404.1 unnamed protein product [Paramecium tetraurelia]|eukprot:XP_001443801.1 hypothetical protein (macronuclear) [Paramecium tetraurelia strain d4-2]
MKNQITEKASINVRCDKCNRKNDLIAECCVVTSHTHTLICCHQCVKVLEKQQKLYVEQINDILSECEQIKQFIKCNNLVELISNSIFAKTLKMSKPLIELLKESKEFQQSSNVNGIQFKNYCKQRTIYKQLLEDHAIKDSIEKAFQNYKSTIRQYFYDEESTLFFSITIPQSKYSVLYFKVLSHYFLILKYFTQLEYLSQIDQEAAENIVMDQYEPSIYVSIYDLNSKTNIYEELLIQNLNLQFFNEELIKSYLFEQNKIIYICIKDEYYEIHLSPKQPPKQINNIKFDVISDNLIYLGLDTLVKFDPIEFEIIQQKQIFERNWQDNQFLISYDKKIHSFIMYSCPIQQENEIFEIIQLDSLRCTKRIIFANYDRYDYNSFSYHNSFNYLINISTVVLFRESHAKKSGFLILFNLQRNKIIRKIPIVYSKWLEKLDFLRNQSIICVKYKCDNLHLFQISTGRNILQFEQLQTYPIMQNEQLAVCIKQDNVKILKLAQ